jgi:general secretion pathway protein F
MRFNIWYEKDKKISTKTIEVNSKEELKYHKSYPLNVINIQEIKKYNLRNIFYNKNDTELLELFYEMSIMLKSKLQIKEIIEILINTKFTKNIQDILYTIDKALNNGYPIYKALEQHKNTLGYLPILFFKLGEQNSNFENAISSLYEILKENNIIKQKLQKVLTYPIILVGALVIALSIIFTVVIPQFEYIFIQLGDNLPLSTYILVKIQKFLFEYYMLVFIILICIYFLIIYLKNRYKSIYDKFIFLNIPYFSDMYRYMMFYKLFLSISLMVKSKFQFAQALINSKNITNNIFLENELNKILYDINNGISISKAFENRDIFDSITIRLLLTAQKTNTLETILYDLKIIYKEKLTKFMGKFTTFLEPFLIFIISSIILWIVLAIMTPVWQLSSIIK